MQYGFVDIPELLVMLRLLVTLRHHFCLLFAKVPQCHKASGGRVWRNTAVAVDDGFELIFVRPVIIHNPIDQPLRIDGIFNLQISI